MSPNLQEHLRSLACEPWLMDGQAFDALRQTVESAEANFERYLSCQSVPSVGGEKAASWMDYGNSLLPKLSVDDGGIAELEIRGAIFNGRADWFDALMGMVGTSNLRDCLTEAAQSKNVRGLMLSIASPGGEASGVPELGDDITALARQKPCHAFTDSMAASGAYWLASSADRITASRSASVGSIGVYTAVLDSSRRYEMNGVKVEVIRNKEGTLKAPGAYNLPLTEAQRDSLQTRIQEIFEDFKAAVCDKRKVPESAMHGQVFRGNAAASNHLVEAVGSKTDARKTLAAAVVRRMTE